MWKEVNTNWYRWNDDTEEWEFNHREPGWVDDRLAPVPESRIQEKSWGTSKWRKERADREQETF